jgi:hypothetical protein
VSSSTPYTSPLGGAASRVDGQVFGDVQPGAPASPALPWRDPRDHALMTLRRFISLLEFRRRGGTDDPEAGIPFLVPEERIHVFQTDNVEYVPPRPYIGVLPGRAIHEPYTIGPPPVVTRSRDVHGAGTVLVRQGDHVETIGLEVVGATHPERQGVVAGLKSVFRLQQDSGALRLVAAPYYGQVVSFRLDESEQLDDEAVSGRRRGHLFIRMSVPEVTLVAYRQLVIPFTSEVIGASAGGGARVR